MSATLYEPINVYKPITSNIDIVDGPFEYFIVAGLRMPMPFTTRMTVVRLANGDLFLHSSIAFDSRLAAALQIMGAVRHLVSTRTSGSGRRGIDDEQRPHRALVVVLRLWLWLRLRL